MLPNQIPPAAPEVVALGSALADVLSSLKKGDNALKAAGEGLPELLEAAKNIEKIGPDIKLAHNQVYIAWAIIQVYEPEPSLQIAAAIPDPSTQQA